MQSCNFRSLLLTLPPAHERLLSVRRRAAKLREQSWNDLWRNALKDNTTCSRWSYSSYQQTGGIATEPLLQYFKTFLAGKDYEQTRIVKNFQRTFLYVVKSLGASV